MCNELQVTLQGQQRTNTDKEELINKWEELGNFQIGKFLVFEESAFWGNYDTVLI